jgi:ABC-type nitrate/sulfonate/bicarbonate transport system substrate-binding protein
MIALKHLALACFLFASATAAHAQSLKLSYSSDSPGALPVWIGKESGLYAKNGLDVQLVRVTGNIAVMAVVANEVNIAFMGGSAAITSNLAGSDAVIVAAGEIATDYSLIVNPKIKSPEQLKGTVIGIASVVGSATTATLYGLQKFGLGRNDVTLMVVGGTPERLAALRTGRIQATLLSPPTSFAAEREGFSILTDVSMPLPYNSVVSTRKFAKQNPDVMRRFIKAHLEAVHLLKTDREAAIRTLAKYLRQTKERELLEKSYAITTGENILPRKQYPTNAGIKTVLDSLVKTYPRAATAKPEEFTELQYIREFDASGFIDALYKNKN